MALPLKPYKVIEPNKKWEFLSFRELARYKDLLYYLVLRDITVLYKQTVLGILWAILNPFITMVVFSVVFGLLAEIPSEGIPYPIFTYAALLPMNAYFSQALTASSGSLIQHSAIFTKVYFPRILIPLTPVISKLIDFSVAFSILIVLMIYYGIYPGVNIIFLPMLIIIMVIFTMGLGLLFSALAVQYRDVRFTLPFLTTLFTYTAPVVFPASLIREKFGDMVYYLYGLYPMAGVVEGFRASLLDKTAMPWDLIGVGSAGALVIFFAGLLFFRRTEKYFADIV